MYKNTSTPFAPFSGRLFFFFFHQEWGKFLPLFSRGGADKHTHTLINIYLVAGMKLSAPHLHLFILLLFLLFFFLFLALIFVCVSVHVYRLFSEHTQIHFNFTPNPSLLFILYSCSSYWEYNEQTIKLFLCVNHNWFSICAAIWE